MQVCCFHLPLFVLKAVFWQLAVAAPPFSLCWINLHPFQLLWIWSISALSSPVNPDNLKCPFVRDFILNPVLHSTPLSCSVKGVESQILREFNTDNPGAAQQRL